MILRRLPVPARRFVYRVGYVVLRVVSQTIRPRTRGVKCLVVREDEVLLVRHSYGPKHWDLAGGFCRRGEEFAAAARREVAEELGVGVVGLTDLGELRRGHNGRHETLRLFRADVDSRELEIDAGELASAQWCKCDALPHPRADLVDVAVERDAAGVASSRPPSETR